MAAQLRKYGTACTINFPLIKAGSQNFAVSGDYTHASGDVKISKDGGAAATATNSPSALTMGNGAVWQLTLTATEMQAAEIVVTIIDATTKAIEDQAIVIHTFGNASAMIVADLSAANVAANVTQFGGSNGTFASGRPEVNASHIAGSAVSTSSAQIGVNVVNAGGTAWGSGAITAAAIAAAALNGKGDWSTYAGGDTSGVTTLLSRVTSAVALNSDVTSATYGLAAIKTLLDAIAGYVDTEVAAIKAKTDNLPASPASTGDIPSASTIATQVNSTLSTSHGSGSWESTPSGGTGAYTRTFTVNDGTTALENATIRVTNGAESYSQQTNASGVAVFALDAATWSIAITKPGYTFAPATLTVSATGSTTYSMTQVSIDPPAGADFSTGSIVCYDEEGNEASGVALTIEIVVGPGTDGWALSTASVTITSNGSGVASFAGFVRGGTYKITRGDGESRTFVVPDADSFDIAEVMGSE